MPSSLKERDGLNNPHAAQKVNQAGRLVDMQTKKTFSLSYLLASSIANLNEGKLHMMVNCPKKEKCTSIPKNMAF